MKRLLRIAAPVLIVLAMLLVFALLPVILPVVAWQTARDRRRRVATAATTDCSVCGARLGAAALDLADAAWAAHVAALNAAHPHARFRLVRRVHAVCPGCGAHYEWREAARLFSRSEDAISVSHSPTKEAE